MSEALRRKKRSGGKGSCAEMERCCTPPGAGREPSSHRCPGVLTQAGAMGGTGTHSCFPAGGPLLPVAGTGKSDSHGGCPAVGICLAGPVPGAPGCGCSSTPHQATTNVVRWGRAMPRPAVARPVAHTYTHYGHLALKTDRCPQCSLTAWPIIPGVGQRLVS
jgi:hypothetical protein